MTTNDKQQHDGLEALLSEAHIQDNVLEDIIHLIYGRRLKYLPKIIIKICYKNLYIFRQIAFNNELTEISNTSNFELKGYSIKAQTEQLRRSRLVF